MQSRVFNNMSYTINLQVQAGRKLVPTPLGITLIRGYQCIDPDLCLPDIRGFIEQQITLVAKGEADHTRVVQHVILQFKQKFSYFVKQVRMLLPISRISICIPQTQSSSSYEICSDVKRFDSHVV